MGPISPASTRREDGASEDPFSSPTSTVVSPVSQYQNPPQPPPVSSHRDDNLPEVYVDTSPHSVWHKPAVAQNPSAYDTSEKYALHNDNDTLKLAVHPDPRDLGAEEAPGDFPRGAMADVERNPPSTEKPASKDKILGLKRKTFFLVLALVLIIVAAAVGGGVGGAVAASSGSDAAATTTVASSTAPPTATSEPPTTTASEAASTTSEAPKPTLTDLSEQTRPEFTFFFQAYEEADFKGKKSPVIRSENGSDLNFDANSYIWKPNANGCCISFCNSQTEKDPDWYCDERYRDQTSGPFKRVFIWCGQARDKANSRCS